MTFDEMLVRCRVSWTQFAHQLDMKETAMQLHQITDEDLVELERLLPLLMQRDTQLDGRGRVQWTRVKTILSNVRFNYGPHSDIEVVGEEPPSA